MNFIEKLSADLQSFGMSDAQAALAAKDAEIAAMAADRDSWYQQASDRLDDALNFATQRDDAMAALAAKDAEVERLKKDATAVDWISVNDRMPDIGAPVFGLIRGGLGVYLRYADSDGWMWCQQKRNFDVLDPNGFEFDEDYEVEFWRPMINLPNDAAITQEEKPS